VSPAGPPLAAAAGAPRVVIEAGRARNPIDPSELWRYRDLLYLLTWRDIAVRYKQTALGVLWAVIQPVASTAVFAVFLGRLAGVPSDGLPYPLFAYLGLMPWTYFAGAVARASASLAGNAHLLTRVYFPRALLPMSAALGALIDFAIALAALGALLAWYGVRPRAEALLAIPVALAIGAVATGVGMGLGALNARYRDVQHAIPFAMQLWMFATPVVYPASLVPDGWRWVLALNPMTGLVEAFRAAIAGRPIDAGALAVSTASAALVAALGTWHFRRAERALADVV
jgi:lipopolysaccharide transport system permease protein